MKESVSPRISLEKELGDASTATEIGPAVATADCKWYSFPWLMAIIPEISAPTYAPSKLHPICCPKNKNMLNSFYM